MGQEPSKEAPEPHAFTSLERIERDRYEIWISGLPRSAISNAVTAALTMVLLRKHPGDITAYGWFFSVIILNILRLALTPKMRGWLQSGKMEKTKRVFSLSLWSSGAIWSLPAIALFPNNNLALQSILAVSLLSVSAGAVLSYVVSPRMALVVPALVLVPFTIRCVFEPTYLSVVLALLCILFLTIIYFLEKDWGNYIEQNLQLSLHNEMLSQKYKAAHEQAMDAINTKEQFLRKMSHEIRTPLNGIQGMAKLLLTQATGGLSRQSLKVIEESGERLHLLINELFGDMSEKQEFATTPFASAPEPRPLGGAPRANILVVEDNPVNQMVLSLHLERAGYRVETASSGTQALALQKNGGFDVVLMDCQMPGLDGFETTRAWRNAERDSGQHTPILAVTANAVSGDRNRCLESGMDDYLPKPVDTALLFQKLEFFLANRLKVTKNKDVAMKDSANTSLNLKALEALRDFDDGKGEILTEVVRRFIETTAELIQPLKGHCEKREWDKVRRITHTVKSSAATVGAISLSELAKRVEDKMRDGNQEGAEADAVAIEKAFKSAVTALCAYVASLKHAA